MKEVSTDNLRHRLLKKCLMAALQQQGHHLVAINTPCVPQNYIHKNNIHRL
jgi:hypothetical protein